MKQFTKFKHAVAAILMLASALCASAFEYEGFEYDIIDAGKKTCALVYNSKSPYTGDITVPATTIYNSGTPWEVEYTVTGIGYKAFASCAGLRSVKLPESVAYIGSYAFAESKNLESVTLPPK